MIVAALLEGKIPGPIPRWRRALMLIFGMTGYLIASMSIFLVTQPWWPAQ